jgi:NADPH-dependent ferric siderophore reductase
VAQQKEARVVHVAEVSATTRVLELEPAERLDFVGGQYLIFNSGIVLGDGKLAKRAYSIVSPDARQERIAVAVRNLGGPGSQWMHERALGDVLPFSGPWGKFLADDARPRRTLVLCTDTGITAALGLVCGRAFAPQLAAAELLWLVESDCYFLSEGFVRAALPGSVRVSCEPLPPVGHPERLAVALQAAERRVGCESVFLAGDGAVLYPMRDRFFADARIECFFNNPAKKAAA